MANKKRTFRGKLIDIEELARKNEKSISVGNMKVNARGDEIDENGNIVRTHDKVVRDHNSAYSKASTKASIISNFEDDDEPIEIKDDPRFLKNSKSKTTKSDKDSDGDSKPAGTEDLD